ncbi:hypothetical protein K439DRAFT_1651802 [Ramaria rubella]|nr:hypothetical protein K439DRAFT_1651802 [Ramaria rubella]
MSRSVSCHFHLRPGGCRKGDTCEFLHAGPSGGLPRGAHSPGQRAPPATSPTPQGVCNEYWTTGRCRRSFGCKYNHRQPNNETTKPSLRTRHTPSLNEENIVSPNLNPTQVHNHLTKFLRDNYRFTMPNDIYAFIRLLGHATNENNWNVEDGQLLMTTLATPGQNGLLRLGDIIRHPDVVYNAGLSPRFVSFQKAYLPLLMYLSSEYVVKSTVNHNVNSLYGLIHSNFEEFSGTIQTCMDGLMTIGTFQDPKLAASSSSKDLIGSRIFSSLSTVLFEYLTRFRHATTTHPTLTPLVHSVATWLDRWITGITSSPSTFEDAWASRGTSESRLFITKRLREQVGRVVTIVTREQDRHGLQMVRETPVPFHNHENTGILAYLETKYIGPGEEREGGPRHNNDFADIRQIRIAPTHEEVTCSHQPYLPANIPNAPHHLPAGSMERLLDIQFRLLREELIAPLRTGIQLILQDLRAAPRKKTTLSALLQKRGGRYISSLESHDNMMFNVYTNCLFTQFHLHPYRGVTVEMIFDAPPGSARSRNAQVRSNFWEGKGGKRLMQGGLVALVWSDGSDVSVYLGIIASSLKDLAASAKQSVDERNRLQICFFDSQVELKIFQAIRNADRHAHTFKLLVEAPVMYETIRPILEALRREPTSLPFPQYLAHPLSRSLATMEINPPKYALTPGFTFDLRCLFKGEPPERLRLNVMEPFAGDDCRQALRASNSRLDPSQADAVVDVLMREVALIQGPPGTGKTYVGVEILRVLLQNNVGPVLMIAFTNHALDHLLSSVLDAGITKKIVRLGTRSADERISQFNLDNLEMLQDKSRLDATLSSQFRILKETQREMATLMESARKATLTGTDVTEYIRIQYADQYESLCTAPRWVSMLRTDEAAEQDAGWRTVGDDNADDSLFKFWEDGKDLLFLIARTIGPAPDAACRLPTNRYDVLDVNLPELSEDESESNDSVDIQPPHDVGTAASWMNTWSAMNIGRASTRILKRGEDNPSLESNESGTTIELNVMPVHDPFHEVFNIDGTPEIPTTDRSLSGLLEISLDMWKLSAKERTRLGRHWRDETLLFLAEEQRGDFSRLRTRYEDARVRYNEIKDQCKVRLLQGIDIVGCTTTGAAKLSALLKSFAPKILLVEEAGQVLEAHILGSLADSVDHLVLIGDPLQLRPNLANYHLSVDSKRGEALYRFDVSLMERLSSFGLKMSQLEVQRRMRPSIANLIRQSLYPGLQDHDLTKEYPHVRGMAKDVFFMSHEHRETGGGEDSVSKHNTFEVQLTVDLVLHFLRQGSYSNEGDIVVLCAYLGQLVRMRDALSGKVVTMIDERDQEQIAPHEEDHEDVPGCATAVQVPVSKKVLLRTVDNFQGEEAKIIILSLVRNSGPIDDEQEHVGSAIRPSIGFLKSPNRVNVALSRAQHGLYIMGNAENLASRSPMWRSILNVLDEQGSLGSAFPMSCPKHPDDRHDISAPGMLPQHAPDGGCLRPCAEALLCGHVCPYKCHSDDENHLSILCSQRCLRFCSQGHPCDKLCSQSCGDCHYPISNVQLPCGHVCLSVPCYLANDPTKIECREYVVKEHSLCEHKFTIACGEDITSYKCKEPCGIDLVCCGRPCMSICSGCQALNVRNTQTSNIPRIFHQAHPCKRHIFCGHPCRADCSEDHECTTRCEERCRQSCEHASCRQPCHVVCAPCAEPCSWTCPHQGKCPVPCGSICARLPCDIRCSKVLPCGHRCPSLCGEPCSICVYCAPAERKKDVVDLIMQTTLEELVLEDSLDALILTLSCGHTFTVASLDGTCYLNDFYRCSDDGRWLGLTTPAPEFRKAPVCPSCRSPINIPRYGRVIKRSTLDSAERNVASDMSNSLGNITRAFGAFDQTAAVLNITRTVSGDAGNPPTLSQQDIANIQRDHLKHLRNVMDKPISPEFFSLAGKGKHKRNIHRVSPPGATSWKTVARPIIRAYSQAIELAGRRAAHTVAYENALSTLYQQELRQLSKHPERAPRQPSENAMRVAKLKVGQPPPRADKRFNVEALWLSLRLRFLMGELAEARLKALNKDTESSASDRFAWAGFIRFIYASCCRDVNLALHIAMKADSYRQVAISHLLELKANFQTFRFDVEMWGQQTRSKKDREALLKEANDKAEEARLIAQDARKDYLSSRRGNSEQEWLLTQFVVPGLKILDQWAALEHSIKADTFYNAVTQDEFTQIVKAFNFSHVGHWYTCPNGHIYVIGECGGAMQVASCPECGSAIGGTNHSLVSANAPAREIEDISRSHGAEASPWQWGQGA